MDNPAYRARGLPISNGTVEGACERLVSARLTRAAMIWESGRDGSGGGSSGLVKE